MTKQANKATFAVRIPSTASLVLCIDGVLLGFCDAHGETREELSEMVESIRAQGTNSIFYALWADEASQRQLQAELDKATDAIRFDY